MKIFVHDYPGHAFPVQLSRELAREGHIVVHAFAAALEAPRGAVEARPDDSPNLTILPIVTGAETAGGEVVTSILHSAPEKSPVQISPAGVVVSATPFVPQAASEPIFVTWPSVALAV